MSRSRRILHRVALTLLLLATAAPAVSGTRHAADLRGLRHPPSAGTHLLTADVVATTLIAGVVTWRSSTSTRRRRRVRVRARARRVPCFARARSYVVRRRVATADDAEPF